MRLLAVSLLVLAACAHGPKTAVIAPLPEDPQAAAQERLKRAAEAQSLQDELRRAHEGPQTLSATAKAFVEAPENGGRYPLNVVVQRPASIHLEALTPVGDPAAVLVAHAGQFALLDLRANVFYRGPSTPQNLSLLLPAPLRDDELVALLTGGVPELPGALPVEVRRAGDERVLVQSTVPPGSPGARGVVQEVRVGDGLAVKEVRRSEVFAGEPRLLWAVRLDEHDDKYGPQLPRLLHLDAPAARTSVDLRLKDILAGKPVSPRAFGLVPPNGMRIEELR